MASVDRQVFPGNRWIRPPSANDRRYNTAARWFTGACGASTIALVVSLLLTIVWDAWPAFREHGFELLFERSWNPTRGDFGLLPATVGTLISSILGLSLAALVGIAIGVFLTQDFLDYRIASLLKNLVDLLAAVPSVVYGLWGLAVVTPLVRPVSEWLYKTCPWIPFFSEPLGIGGLAPAAIVLAIMILPTIAAISRDSLAAVNPRIKEAAYGLGATRWEVILRVMLPTALGGIAGGLILAFGRALGETMALAMLMGNRNDLSWSIFAPGNTLAALIANNYKEADDVLIPRLIYAAAVLLVITMVVNIVGTLVLQRATARFRGEGKQ
jgi:phosphate transport system permease protein